MCAMLSQDWYQDSIEMGSFPMYIVILRLKDNIA